MSSGRSTTSSSSSRGTSSTATSHPRWATSSIVISCRVLDLVFVTKDADGAIEGFELGDIDAGIAGEIEKLEIDIAHVLSEDDVVSLAAAMEPDSSAALLVWENKWAAPFASAVRHSGGQLVASGRIPIQALIGALEDEDEGA